MVNSPYYDRYDNPYWEFHLPVNSPISPGNDVDVEGNPYTYPWLLDHCDLGNWFADSSVVYRSRLKEPEIQ